MNKRYYTKSNGDTIVDLTMSSVDMSVTEPVITNIIAVTEDFAMRPDLIAKTFFGDDGMLDLLLKYNGISNPFSLAPGDLLAIPEPIQMKKMMRMPMADEDIEYSMEVKEFKYFDEAVKRDNKRMMLLMQKAKNKELLPPNVNQPGDKNIKFKDGKVVFGEDVTAINKQNCPETLTRARVKEKLLNNQIFK